MVFDTYDSFVFCYAEKIVQIDAIAICILTTLISMNHVATSLGTDYTLLESRTEREKETSFKDACRVKVHSVVFFLGNLRRLNAFTWHSEQQAGDVLRCQRVRR